MVSLKVDGLSHRTNTDDLESLFEKYGKVGDVYIPKDYRTKDNRGFGFVRYFSKHDAEDAIDSLDGRKFDGRELSVQYARYDRPERDYGRGGGERGGRGSDRGGRKRSRSRSRSRGDRRRSSRSRSRGDRSKSRDKSRSKDRSKDRSKERSRRSRSGSDDRRGSDDRKRRTSGRSNRSDDD